MASARSAFNLLFLALLISFLLSETAKTAPKGVAFIKLIEPTDKTVAGFWRVIADTETHPDIRLQLPDGDYRWTVAIGLIAALRHAKFAAYGMPIYESNESANPVEISDAMLRYMEPGDLETDPSLLGFRRYLFVTYHEPGWKRVPFDSPIKPFFEESPGPNDQNLRVREDGAIPWLKGFFIRFFTKNSKISSKVPEPIITIQALLEYNILELGVSQAVLQDQDDVENITIALGLDRNPVGQGYNVKYSVSGESGPMAGGRRPGRGRMEDFSLQHQRDVDTFVARLGEFIKTELSPPKAAATYTIK